MPTKEELKAALRSRGKAPKAAPAKNFFPGGIPERYASFEEPIRLAAEKYGVPEQYLWGILHKESSGNPDIKIGEDQHGWGPFQIDDRSNYGWLLEHEGGMNPYTAAEWAAEKLSERAKAYKGNWDKAFAAYNAGQGNVKEGLAAGKTLEQITHTPDYIATVKGSGEQLLKNIAARRAALAAKAQEPRILAPEEQGPVSPQPGEAQSDFFSRSSPYTSAFSTAAPDTSPVTSEDVLYDMPAPEADGGSGPPEDPRKSAPYYSQRLFDRLAGQARKAGTEDEAQRETQAILRARYAPGFKFKK